MAEFTQEPVNLTDDLIDKAKLVHYQFTIDDLINKVVDLTIKNEVFLSTNKCLERRLINTVSELEDIKDNADIAAKAEAEIEILREENNKLKESIRRLNEKMQNIEENYQADEDLIIELRESLEKKNNLIKKLRK